MTQFHFIDATVHGYQTVFSNYKFYARLIIIPLIVKISCLYLIHIFDLIDNPLRQGLILLPSYFVDGWLMAHAVRFAVLGDRPLSMTGYDPNKITPEYLDHKARAVMSCIGSFVLACLLFAMFKGVLINPDLVKEIEATPNQADSGLLDFIIALALLYATVWLTRYLWIYIIFALGLSARQFYKANKNILVSIEILASYFMALAPLLLLSAITSEIVINLLDLSIQSDETALDTYYYAMTPFLGLYDLCSTILCSCSIAFLIKSFYTRKSS